MSDLARIIREDFPQKKILVIGDLVADQFLQGTIARVSREAPVFILRHEETETFAGGAANAAVNIASLGGQAILVGLTGSDANGQALLQRLEKSNVSCHPVISSSEITTTTKVRVLAAHNYAARQQVIRIDYENTKKIPEYLTAQLIENITECAAQADAIMFSDYDYGVVTEEIFGVAKEISDQQRIPLLVDSRFHLSRFLGATSATPNQDEVEQILGKNFLAEDCAALSERLNLEALLVTRGNQGMLLAEKHRSPLHIEAVGSKEPIDVTGAGDTVIAVYALGLACGLSFAESATLANHAGGIVVMKKWTASVSADELIASIADEKISKSIHLSNA